MSLQQNIPYPMMLTLWGAQLNPLLANPMMQGVAINSVVLSTTPKEIPTTLNRMQLGWFITDINGAATVYRSQPFTNNTLTLVASATVTVNLWCF